MEGNNLTKKLASIKSRIYSFYGKGVLFIKLVFTYSNINFNSN